MIYAVPVRYSGRIYYYIKANSEQEAMEQAAEMAEEADCGLLEDIEWEVKKPSAQY